MAMSTTSPVYREARAQVLALLRDIGQPMVTKAIFPHITVVQNLNDLSTVLNLMTTQGYIQRGPKIKHENQLKNSYQLSDHPSADPVPTPAPAFKSEPPHMTFLEQPAPTNQDQDALIDQLNRYPLAHSEFTQQDSARLRALADSTLFSTHLLDWSFYLYDLANRIESQTLTPNP